MNDLAAEKRLFLFIMTSWFESKNKFGLASWGDDAVFAFPIISKTFKEAKSGSFFECLYEKQHNCFEVKLLLHHLKLILTVLR